mmetsp:Transcript_45587/g.120518  ORF Transcript_45587/g.120518 Transcript_45587/m.120518 type:complete len:588 (+) Transcript_45587:90-1853(+)
MQARFRNGDRGLGDLRGSKSATLLNSTVSTGVRNCSDAAARKSVVIPVPMKATSILIDGPSSPTADAGATEAQRWEKRFQIAERQRVALQQSLDGLFADKEALEKRHSDLQNENYQLRNDLEAIEARAKEAEETIEALIKESSAAKDTPNPQLALLQTKLVEMETAAHHHSHHRLAAPELEAAQREIAELKSDLEHKEVEVKTLRSSLAEFEIALEQAAHAGDAVRQRLEARVSAVQAEVEAKVADIKDLTERLETAVPLTRHAQVVDESADLRSQLRSLDSQHRALQKTNDALQAQVSSLRSDLADARIRANEAGVSLPRCEQAETQKLVADLRAELEASRSEVHANVAEAAILREEMSEEQIRRHSPHAEDSTARAACSSASSRSPDNTSRRLQVENGHNAFASEPDPRTGDEGSATDDPIARQRTASASCTSSTPSEMRTLLDVETSHRSLAEQIDFLVEQKRLHKGAREQRLSDAGMEYSQSSPGTSLVVPAGVKPPAVVAAPMATTLPSRGSRTSLRFSPPPPQAQAMFLTPSSPLTPARRLVGGSHQGARQVGMDASSNRVERLSSGYVRPLIGAAPPRAA